MPKGHPHKHPKPELTLQKVKMVELTIQTVGPFPPSDSGGASFCGCSFPSSANFFCYSVYACWIKPLNNSSSYSTGSFRPRNSGSIGVSPNAGPSTNSATAPPFTSVGTGRTSFFIGRDGPRRKNPTTKR